MTIHMISNNSLDWVSFLENSRILFFQDISAIQIQWFKKIKPSTTYYPRDILFSINNWFSIRKNIPLCSQYSIGFTYKPRMVLLSSIPYWFFFFLAEGFHLLKMISDLEYCIRKDYFGVSYWACYALYNNGLERNKTIRCRFLLEIMSWGIEKWAQVEWTYANMGWLHWDEDS